MGNDRVQLAIVRYAAKITIMLNSNQRITSKRGSTELIVCTNKVLRIKDCVVPLEELLNDVNIGAFSCTCTTIQDDELLDMACITSENGPNGPLQLT